MINKFKYIFNFLNSTLVLRLSVLLSFLMFVPYSFKRISKFSGINDMRGDDFGFLEHFERYLSNGYYQSVKEGTSVLFFGVSSWLYKLTDHKLLSLKWISLLSSIGLVLVGAYLLRRFKIHGLYFYSSLFFMLSLVIGSGYFFSAVDDTLLHFLTLLCFVPIINVIENKNVTRNLLFTGILMGLMLTTRLMAILILPSMVLIFLLNRISFRGHLKVLTTFLITVFIFQFPSILNNHKLSSYDKVPDNGYTWTQLQYLSQLKYNDGTLPKGQHVGWEEVGKYLEINGANALPKTLAQSLVFDPQLTVIEFFKDLFYDTGIILLRNCQYSIFLILIFLIAFFFKKIRLEENQHVIYSFSLGLILFYLIISFIIISNVEGRWYYSFLLMQLIVGSYLAINHPFFKNYKNFIFLISLISLSLFHVKYLIFK